jgi:hypothetical protein
VPQAYGNLNELAKYLNKVTNQSLATDVGNKVKQVMQEHVVEDVYDEYTPTIYERTGRFAKEIEITSIQNGVEVSPTREENGRYIPAIIETGKGYSWKGSEIYKTKQKRPFVERTIDELVQKNTHVEELKKSLRKKGLDVK